MVESALAAEGHDALVTAVRHGHLDAVRLLLLSIPSAEQRSVALRSRGATRQRPPLQWASWGEHTEIFRLILG